MNSTWLDTFKRWITTTGLVAAMSLAASDALVVAGQGQEDAAASSYAPCSWCRSDILWRSTLGDTWMWNGSYWSFLGSVGNDWQIQGVGDFDGDGLDDILWRSVYGDNAIWPSGIAPGYWIEPVDNEWRVVGIGDFDGDRKSDILWRSVYGYNAIWPSGIAPGYWLVRVDNNWQVAGIGDFNSDRKSDILWRGRYGDNVIWRGGNASGFPVPSLDGNWQVQGVGDFDRNGQSDILWRCTPASFTTCGTTTAGTVAIFAFSNGNYGWPIRPGVLDFNWEIHGVGDFDANGESDILWRCLPKSPATACGDAQDGSTAIWQFSNGLYGWTTWLPYVLSRNWKIQGVGHFDWY